MGTHVCVICEYGWIIVGVMMAESGDTLTLSDSSVVRSWRNGKGIGCIARAENKDEYTLDEIGTVVIKKSKILFTIPCEW